MKVESTRRLKLSRETLRLVAEDGGRRGPAVVLTQNTLCQLTYQPRCF